MNRVFLTDLYIDLTCAELALNADQDKVAINRIRSAKEKINREIDRPFSGEVQDEGVDK